jgi:aspartate/methionine/tyrosine aminotransferase
MTAAAPRDRSNLPPLPVNDVVASMGQAESIRINQIVYDLRRAGVDPITLSLGEAFFDIPLFDFTRLDIEKSYHYSDSQGLPELRDKIAGYYASRYGAAIDADREVLISAGSKVLIFMAMLATLRPGDEVLIHEPAWLSYPEQAALVGARARFIPYDTPVARFREHFSPRTRMMVVCNPNNPAGRIYTEGELRALHSDCRGAGIHLLVDEAYSDFAEDGFASLARIVPDKDGVIVVNSLSKNLGISGWRIGYAITSEPVMRQMLKLNQHIVTCAPTILLQYVARYLDEILAVTLPQVRDVTAKRARVAAMIDRLGLKQLSGSATFYFFVGIGDWPGTSVEFAESLLRERHIAVVPGSAYGKSVDRFVRVSIGTESEERIWEALQVMADRIG